MGAGARLSPENATIHGPEAVWAFMLEINEPWEEGSYELVEAIDGGNDKAAAHMVRHVRGATSGVAAEPLPRLTKQGEARVKSGRIGG